MKTKKKQRKLRLSRLEQEKREIEKLKDYPVIDLGNDALLIPVRSLRETIEEDINIRKNKTK